MSPGDSGLDAFVKRPFCSSKLWSEVRVKCVKGINSNLSWSKKSKAATAFLHVVCKTDAGFPCCNLDWTSSMEQLCTKLTHQYTSTIFIPYQYVIFTHNHNHIDTVPGWFQEICPCWWDLHRPWSLDLLFWIARWISLPIPHLHPSRSSTSGFLWRTPWTNAVATSQSFNGNRPPLGVQ